MGETAWSVGCGLCGTFLVYTITGSERSLAGSVDTRSRYPYLVQWTVGRRSEDEATESCSMFDCLSDVFLLHVAT